jgi:hypothetical protein
MKQPKMDRGRTIQRIAHTIDNIGGRDIPHAIIHLQDAQKASTLKEAKDHIQRALGHAKELSEQSGMLSEAIKIVPGVTKEAKRLAVEQTKSDGLVQDKPKAVKKSTNPKSKTNKVAPKKVKKV